MSQEVSLLLDFLKRNMGCEFDLLDNEIKSFEQLDFEEFMKVFEMNDFILSE